MNANVAFRGMAIGAVAGLAGFIAGALVSESGGLVVLFAAAVAAIAAAVAYGALLNSARAVHSVRLAADRVAEGDLEQRVHAAPGPVAELTHAFNTMASRVQRLVGNIAAEEARLQAVFDASSDAMVAVAADTSVRFVNPAALELFGATQGSIGRPFIEMARDYQLDGIVRRGLAEGEHEPEVVNFGPRRIPLRAAALPIPHGGAWAVLLLLTDLTEVQRVDQVRRDFVSNVSHELRTPLASIRAMVETLQDDESATPDEEKEFLGRIHVQVDRLTLLVNELLDLSRIESGAIELRPEEFALGEVVREAASLLSTRSETQGVSLICPPAGEGVIEADRASVLRIVTNLLDNAIKHTPPGKAVRIGIADEDGLVALTVSDEGDGIPYQDLERVFERFYKRESARATAGAGLGLAIVKHLVRAHGGTVAAESPPGEGASFTVRLPKRFAGRR